MVCSTTNLDTKNDVTVFSGGYKFCLQHHDGRIRVRRHCGSFTLLACDALWGKSEIWPDKSRFYKVQQKEKSMGDY